MNKTHQTSVYVAGGPKDGGQEIIYTSCSTLIAACQIKVTKHIKLKKTRKMLETNGARMVLAVLIC